MDKVSFHSSVEKHPKTNQGHVTLSGEIPSRWSFTLMTEAGLEHLFKSFRLLKEIQISNEEWDKTVYIVGDSPEIRDLFVKFPDLQKATYALIKSGFAIEFNSGKITAHKKSSSEEAGYKDLEEASPHFEELLCVMKKVKESGLDQSLDYSQVISYLFYFFIPALALSLVIYAHSLTETEITTLPSNAGFYGFLLGGFSGFLALILWRLLRKLNSRSHYEFTILFCLLPISLAIAGASSSLYVNRILDLDPGTIVKAIVSRQYSFRNKYGTHYVQVYTYHLPRRIKKTYKGSHFEEFVTEDFYLSSHPGDYKMVRIYPGFYGQPWMMK